MVQIPQGREVWQAWAIRQRPTAGQTRRLREERQHRRPEIRQLRLPRAAQCRRQMDRQARRRL